MASKLTGQTIALLGGDAREKILMQQLVAVGARVKAVGFKDVVTGVELLDNIPAAIEDAAAVILPLTGVDNGGRVRVVETGQAIYLDEKLLAQLKPGTPVLIGLARPYLRKLAQQYGFRLIETADLDEIAIPNAIPTAEGAIKVAIEETPITIHGSTCLILGCGRVGTVVAAALKGLGARTVVLSREPLELVKAEVAGHCAAALTNLPLYIKEANFVFNTIPFSVLTESILREMLPSGLVIDLASAPGGTDFTAAQQLGIKALLCPGLPGKVAPHTAGQILARVIPVIIERELFGE